MYQNSVFGFQIKIKESVATRSFIQESRSDEYGHLITDKPNNNVLYKKYFF